MLTLEEYEAKHLELQDLPLHSTVTGLDGTLWTKSLPDLWSCAFGIRKNSLAMVSEFIDYNEPKEKKLQKNSLFDL